MVETTEQTYSKHINAYKFSQGFTTETKTRRLTWHKQRTVRIRAAALQESFFPTKDVPYEAVKLRMALFLGICDRASVLSYLGRPETTLESEVDQRVRYASGSIVNKRHRFKRRLAARKGYIEAFGLGYVYVVNGEWWVHWRHTEQTTLDSNQSEGNSPGASITNFSLSNNSQQQLSETPSADEKHHVHTEIEKRESESERERNLVHLHNEIEQLNPLERAVLRVAESKNKDPGG